MKNILLQSRPGTWRNVHWNPTPELATAFSEGIEINDPVVAKLVEELDRRFVQLWDKVDRERKNSAEVDSRMAEMYEFCKKVSEKTPVTILLPESCDAPPETQKMCDYVIAFGGNNE